MANKIKALGQVLRIDGKNCFAEVMLDAAAIDKILIHMVSYNANAAAGNRLTGDVSIYINVFDALVLSGDILSGKLKKIADKHKKDAEAKAALPENNGKRVYPEPAYILLGGTSGANTSDKKPISRQFKLSGGVSQPWVMEATSGPGKTIGKGLIAPDGLPTTIVRLGLDDNTVKKFAYALEMCVRLWSEAKFLPVIAPMMQEVRAQTESALQSLKSNNAPGPDLADDPGLEGDELPY